MGSLRKPLYMTTEGFSDEMADADELKLGLLTMSGNIVMGNNKVTGLGTPLSDGDAASKGYVDQAVISGGRIKEALWSYKQLDNTDGINALGSLYFASQPAINDTVVFKNGTLTRTYTFVADIAGEATATDVSRETDAATAMNRLCVRAMADAGNTQWDLYKSILHADINSTIVDVIERATASGNSTSRIYTNGAWGTPGECKVVDFTTAGVPNKEYVLHSVGAAATSDPTNSTFGLRRQQSALVDGEIHFTLDSDEQWAWNADDTAWYLLSAGAVPDATSASGGGIKGKMSVDSDYGLQVNSGVLKIDVEPDYGLQFVGGDLGVLPDTTAGIKVGAGGVGIKLGTTNPGLEFTGGGAPNDLQVKADGSHGVIRGATGLEIEIDDTPDTLDVDADGLKVVGLPLQFKINDGTCSTGVTHTNLNTLVAGASSYADSLHTHARVDAAKQVSASYASNEAISKGDPVYWQASDALGKGDAGNDAKAHVIGVAADNIANPGSGIVISEGVAVGVGSTWTANQPIYLKDGGGLTNTIPTAGKRIIVMGYAKNGTDLFVDIRDYGKKAA